MPELPPGHLSEADVATILAIAQEAGAILIGGQSVAILAARYWQKFPELHKTRPLTSDDVDFYGGQTAAQIVVSRLKDADIYLPAHFDDATPNAAKISAMVGTQRITIDFMGSIIWVEQKGLEQRFLTFGGTHPETGESIKILCLHPLDCLTSRLGNINVLNRSDDQALRSAKASIIILDAFIDELLSDGNAKDAQTTLRKIEFIIKNKCARHRSFLDHGLDPRFILKKYASDERLDGRYRSKSLSSALRRVNDVCERAAARHANRLS
ncbi:hypothetical protein SAMN05519103_04551 [Rhizobiales bacterium GAS113]|nr:hypothetical protein SAMN05519103_04551 [Rhizobiales bacterium GAS113]